MTPAGQLLVEIVEHEIAKEGRERTALRGALLHRTDQTILHLRRGNQDEAIRLPTQIAALYSITPALRQARMSLSTRLSDSRAATRAIKPS